MKVLVIGSAGTIGRAVAAALVPQHEVIGASRSQGERVDLAERASIERLFDRIGALDAVVCAAGEARFQALAAVTDEDIDFSIRNKLLGQVNLARVALPRLRAGGSLTLTSGVLSHQPMPGSTIVSMVNAGLEGFVRAAALEAPTGVRVNVVCMGWVKETMVTLGMDPAPGTAARDVAQSFVDAIEGAMTGQVLVPARRG
jgi:NAD(P)-dependent dehydrogenase (short-subunit alcohol dehydrogenase family)